MHARIRYHRAEHNWHMVRVRKHDASYAHGRYVHLRRTVFRGGSPSSNRRLGHQMAAQRGWRGSQWRCLRVLWHGESGWRTRADNPTSSAYGIPQSLPGRKMASAGRDWRTNPHTQIRWGLRYIARRYGGPCKALAFWRAQSPHWY